jgi:hypothetical protein
MNGPVAAARVSWMSFPHIAALRYLHRDSTAEARKGVPDKRFPHFESVG